MAMVGRLPHHRPTPDLRAALLIDDQFVIHGFSIGGMFAAAVRNQVVSRPRVMTGMRRVFAGSFVALGAKLAVTQR